MRFGSRGPNESPCRSSRIRHRNALTEKAWEDALQGLFRATVELALVYGAYCISRTGLDWTGLVKRGLVKRGLVKRGLVKRGLVKRGLVKRGLVKRGLVKRGLVKRGLRMAC